MSERKKSNPKNPFFKETIFYAAWRCLVEWSFAPLANYFEGEWDTVKHTAKNASGICLLFAVVFLTLGYFWKGHDDELIRTGYSNTNSFLSGQLSEMSNEVQHLQGQIDKNQQDYENKIASIKTDFNETKREQDAQIAELFSEKESAQARLSFFEANPEKLSEIYSNIFAHAPTNFQQFDLTFEQLNVAVSNIAEIETATKQLQINASQSQYSTNQLADLGIEKLPDGRIKMGSMITGKPTVVIGAWDAGIQSFTNKDFQTALENFQKAINAIESSKQSGAFIETGGSVMPDGEARLYAMAATCAMNLQSNSLANEFAEKSVSMNSDPRYKILLTETTANLALQDARSNNVSGSFELFQKAIANYESVENLNTNLMPKAEVIQLYNQGANVASYFGKTNEANNWREKLAAILKF